MELRRSVFWTSTQFVTVMAIELLGLAVLARLLTPAEMGAFAVAFALLQFAQFLGGFGLNTVILRAESMDLVTRSRILGLALAATLLVISAYLLALLLFPGFTAGPLPRDLLLIMLPVAVLNCFSMTGYSLMVRELRFRGIFALRLLSTLSYQAVAIPLAVADYGPFSLATGFVAAGSVFAIGMLIATRGAFLVAPRLQGAWAITRLAGVVFATTALQQARDLLVVQIVGRMAGLGPLGVYSRGSDLVQQTNRVVTETVIPVFAPYIFRSVRNGEDSRALFLQSLTMISAISWSVAVVLSALSEPLVRVLLGPQWGEVAQLLHVMAFLMAIFPFGAVAGTFNVAHRQEVRLMIIGACTLVVTVIVTPMVLPYGLPAVSAAVIAVQALGVVFSTASLQKHHMLTAPDVWSAIRPSLGVALSAGLPVLALMSVAPGFPAAVLLLLGVALAATGWGAGLALFRHPLGREIAALLRRGLRHGQSQTP
jgi:O-antigen/teichoic acid export membrane protein